jgi:homoserine kinase
MSEPFRIQFPATSANLGSGFDAVAVALGFHLTIEAEPAPVSNPVFSIHATGRDAERCARLEDNLILDLYRATLSREGRPIVPLAIRMKNEIPLGMGCGSSAAGRLAALALAVHFGGLAWPHERILDEAARLEGHPDNAAACWHGGFVAATDSATNSGSPEKSPRVRFARATPPAAWRAIVVLPTEPLATSKARAVLPESYGRADVVANIQSASLLGLAFAQGRADLLASAMADRIHQPYREAICPMLPRILPLAGQNGILGASLSGAGPAMLVIADDEESVPAASEAIHGSLAGLPPSELLVTSFQSEGASAYMA